MEPDKAGAAALIGHVLGGIELEQVLGTGATGAVFLGKQSTAGHEQVAVKVLMLPMQLSESQRTEFRQRFHREAGLLQLLRHPGILPVEAFGEDLVTGLSYMVLPYMPGGTLATQLARGRLPLHEVGAIVERVAAALEYAHQRGIVHRDLKPANILLDNRRQPHLADFSIARLFEWPDSTMTASGMILGTAQYMAPEQARGEHVGPAADIYSLGIITYQMVVGQVPFSAQSLPQLILQHIQQPPPSPRVLCPQLPEPAEAAILQALAKHPQDRYVSCDAFSRAFTDGLSGRWSRQPTPVQVGSMSDARVSNSAPTLPAYRPNPTQFAESAGATIHKQRSSLWMVWAVIATVLIIALATAVFVRGPGSVQPNDSNVSQATSTPPITFRLNATYAYSVVIGHTKPNAYTNDDVIVTLESLSLDESAGVSQLVVSFHNNDTEKGADLAFADTSTGLPPQNVFMIDNNSIRYPAVVATPNEIVIGPGETQTVTISLSLIQPNVSGLSVYFNTKFHALVTQCTFVTPAGQASPCVTS